MDWHPHCMKLLEACGVRWASENDARFEDMFAKLLVYWWEYVT